jgi:predicted peptidase
VLAPQNPHKKRLWDDTAVMLLLDEIVERYRLDRNRVYLSGLSRGAYGAWRLVVQYTDRFAALIAISGEALMNYARWIGGLTHLGIPWR